MTFFVNLISGILILILIILVADLIIQKQLAKKGGDINTIPAGPLVRDISLVVRNLVKKFIKLETEESLTWASIIVVVALYILIQVIF
ncbi:MAG: hypothetical protein J7L42_00820 [Elusimicrobia bacterium]|nr:hypothetical protein [Elusimicrobiota bacterium]